MATQRQAATKIPRWDIIISILVALLAAVPLWGPGMINTRGGGDSPFLLQRTMDIADSLSHGIFPVRWMAHAAYGLGYPFFNHYAALPYYISGGLTALGISPIIAIQTTQTLGFILAAFGMMLWARQIYKSQAAVALSIIAYTLVPFHMVNVYVRGDSLSEFYAFIWYPLILWALDRVGRSSTRFNIAIAGLAYGGLILTHNVSAVIFSPFALLYILVTKWIYQPIDTESEGITARTLLEWGMPLVLPFIAGILLTTLFWLPAIGELNYGQMGSEFTAGYFHYSNHFRALNLVQTTSFFDYNIATDTGEAGPFAMGLVQAALALAGAISLGLRILVDKEIARKLYVYNLFGLFLATLMITPLSKPLWDYLPLLETTQFPWRFLSIQGLFTAITTGSLLEIIKNAKGELPKHTQVIQTVGFLCLGGLLVVSTLLSLYPERLLITDKDINWENLLLYETFTGNIGTTIRYEYLPRNVVPRLYISELVLDGQGKLIAQPGNELNATLIKQTPIKQIWNIIIESQSSPVTFPLNWWPGWQAKVNGVKTNTYPMPGSGRLTIDLPQGEHTITLQLRNTPLRNVATAISILSLLAGLVLLRNDLTGLSALQWRKLWAIPLGLLIALGLSAIFNITQPLPQITTFDFNQIPYPHHGSVDFQGVQLTQVSPLPQIVHPGAEIDIQLQWHTLQSLKPITVAVSLVSPAEPRHNVPYRLTQTTTTLELDTSVKLTVPEDIARGLYLVELRLYNQDGELYPYTESGQGRGTIYIGAVRVRQGIEQQQEFSPVASFTGLTLYNLETTQPDQTTLQIKMQWSTPGTPHNWSLSLRLQDNNGRQITQRDLQPGYGYLPTTLWEPEEEVTDYITLEIPAGLAPGNYGLQVITYLEATMNNGGEALIPIVLTQTTQKSFTGEALCEFESLALTNLELPERISEGSSLDFYVEWSTLRQPEVDYQARWEVIDHDQQVIATTDGPLSPGSQTQNWTQDTWVRTPVHIDLPAILTGSTYALKLSLINEAGKSMGCELPTPLAIESRPRLFEIPEIPNSQEAVFGEDLRLLGYSLDQDSTGLNLTLWWQSTNAPLPDYKRFVHFYSPGAEQILAQDDAMPRNWTYPTSQWAAGEVVSETVTLDLTAIEAGEYHIAVGWYNPETMARLETQDAQGVPDPAQRVVLGQSYHWGN